MSDPLHKLLKRTQRAETVHLNEQSCVGKGTLQWFLENDAKTHPIHNRNALQLLVCSEGFAALEQDIRKATSTIDLVCWGFDPAMELTRMSPTADPTVDGYKTWPRGTPYGDLLADKAALGVKVRILLWYDSAFLDAIKGSPLAAVYAPAYAIYAVKGAAQQGLNLAAGNAADLPLIWQPMPGFASAYKQAPRVQTRNAKPTSAEVRQAYAKAWWHAALSGGIKNLEVRFRQGSAAAVASLQAAYLPSAGGLSEVAGMQLAATHHQKPVLIDYHPGQGGDPKAAPNTCGYVMGLNSVTDYWDSPEHLYNDPRREVAFGKGAFWLKPWHLKPYRDYAMRVQGQALECLNRNFVKAWDRAQTTTLAWPSASLEAARQAIRPQAVGAHRAQVVRTQPEEADATILKAYVQACSNACNYIYIENQYFQLSEWVQYIKTLRQDTLTLLRQGGGSKQKLPPLHLMVVTPQAERNEMVPSTYDSLAQMGQATSVRGYHRQVEQVQSGQTVTDNTGRAVTDAKGLGRLEMLRRSAQISQSKIQEELSELNIKTFAAMLMTYDHDNEARSLQVKARDNKAQDAQAAQEQADYQKQQSTAQRAAAPHAQAGARDDIAGDYSEYHIRPQRYREVYIHSKLMIVDDSFITLGSANLNARSMVGDSELNIAVAEHPVASQARKRIWGDLAGSDLDGGDGRLATVQEQFPLWIDRMKANASKRAKGSIATAPEQDSFIHTHDDARDAPLLRLA